MGDYIRDEDFDGSFESLTNLTAALGEVKPRNTPSHIIASLPSGKYGEWATPGSDERCPVCLDDYQADDELLKITDCSHWFHRGCLEQWLGGANTCPVCRKRVEGKKRREPMTVDGQPEAGPSRRRTTMTTMTTCLFLVVVAVGEGPTIRLLELAQVLGQPSPRGTSKTLVSQKSIPWIGLCQLRTHADFFPFPHVHVGYS